VEADQFGTSTFAQWFAVIGIKLILLFI
jgi:hypothetical protein